MGTEFFIIYLFISFFLSFTFFGSRGRPRARTSKRPQKKSTFTEFYRVFFGQYLLHVAQFSMFIISTSIVLISIEFRLTKLIDPTVVEMLNFHVTEFYLVFFSFYAFPVGPSVFWAAIVVVVVVVVVVDLAALFSYRS